MNDDVVVVVDAGTTTVKVAAFRTDAPGPLTVTERSYPLDRPGPGMRVQDPDVVADRTMDGLAEVVARVGADRVVAVALSTAMHGLIALDSDDRPLTPLVTWADTRAGAEAAHLRGSGQAPELHRRSGTPVHPMSPLTKLLWLARHEPALHRRATHWVGLKEHLLSTLTGRLVTELSSASATGLLDSANRRWDPDLVALAGIAPCQLPPILPTTAVLPLAPHAADRIGLPTGTPIVTGAGDGPLANVGSGAVGRGIAALSLGTSGAVRATVADPVVDPGCRLFCYALAADTWVVGGAVSNGGIVNRWISDVLAPGALDDAMSVPPGSDGLVVLPYLLGERAPLWDPDATGGVIGLRFDHTAAHLARATVEGVALHLGSLIDILDEVEPIHAVHATGGTFRSALWRSVVAAATDRPVTLAAATEGSALGAAALALVALDRSCSIEEAGDRLRGRTDGAAVPVAERERQLYTRLRNRLPALVQGHRQLLEPETGCSDQG